MNVRRITLKYVAAAIGLSLGNLLAATPSSAAQTTLTVLYAFPDLFRPAMQELAKRFEAANPDIKIAYRAPAPRYEQALQTLLQESVSGTQPDVVEQGLNSIRPAAESKNVVALDTFIASDPGFKAEGLSAKMMRAGKVGEKTYALPLAISLPVVYYNTDLVKRAGGDPAHLPTTWDGVIDLAKRINRLGTGADGVFYAWDETGNWLWQALVTSRGGTMLDATERKVAFDGAEGHWAMRTLSRIVVDGKMPYLTDVTARQQFAAGGLGIFVTSSSQMNAIEKATAGSFPIAVGVFPDLQPGRSTLPSGGNGLMITAKDPAKQQAAWRFIKFATQPEQSASIAESTGYFPPNEKASALMQDFYAKNPNFAVAVSEQPYAAGWYAFPGVNGLKIIDVIKDGLEKVASGEQANRPDAVLKDMASSVQALLPPSK